MHGCSYFSSFRFTISLFSSKKSTFLLSKQTKHCVNHFHFVFFNASFFDVQKVEKGPKEVLNVEVQKDALTLEEQEVGSVSFRSDTRKTIKQIYLLGSTFVRGLMLSIFFCSN